MDTGSGGGSGIDRPKPRSRAGTQRRGAASRCPERECKKFAAGNCEFAENCWFRHDPSMRPGMVPVNGYGHQGLIVQNEGALTLAAEEPGVEVLKQHLAGTQAELEELKFLVFAAQSNEGLARECIASLYAEKNDISLAFERHRDDIGQKLKETASALETRITESDATKITLKNALVDKEIIETELDDRKARSARTKTNVLKMLGVGIVAISMFFLSGKKQKE